jgi:hypothetical protein
VGLFIMLAVAVAESISILLLVLALVDSAVVAMVEQGA